jgi:hypothetical protein
MLTKVINGNKEIIKLYNENGDYIGNAYVHEKIKDNNICIIIESNDKINPAKYTHSIFSFLKPILINNKNVHVYLDLSNYYGINNSSWLYEWVFKVNNNQLIETDFVRIDKWRKVSNTIDYAMLQDYLFKKFNG